MQRNLFTICTITALMLLQINVFAQYQLVWSDEFDGNSLDPAIWNVEQVEGIWNTGANQEMQHYRKENVSVGDDGNGNNCLILTAKKETYNNYNFTSGKVTSDGKFSFRYGKIEARIKLPDLKNGLWPAFWLLGYTPKTWPECGEIDIIEAGHAEGIENNKQNTTFGGALHWDNNGNYAGHGTTSVAPSALNDGFHTYTLEWTPTDIKMYLDGSTTPYFSMNITGDDVEEFRDYPMFVILNLAVGGSFTGITNENLITAPMPAKMYVDYVKVYQQTGSEDYTTSPEMYDNFGVFSERSSTFGLEHNFDDEIVTSNLTENTSVTPNYGSQVLAYDATAGSAANIAVKSSAIRNMTNYTANGGLEFYINTTVTDDITVSVKDNAGGGSSLVLNSAFDGNPARDGSWQKVIIPLSQLTGNVDFTAIETMLDIVFTSTLAATVAIDEVVWTTQASSLDYYGIYTENPGVTDKFLIDNENGNMFIWENSMIPLNDAPTFEGEDVIALSSNPLNSWYGFGINSASGIDLSHFADGYLHVSIKSSSTNTFWIGMQGANNSEAKITFTNGSGLYGFAHDGKWHSLVIPMSALTSQGLDLSSCGNIFIAGGDGQISDLAFDEIVVSSQNTIPVNPNLNPDRDSGTGTSSNVDVITHDHYGIYSENTNINNHFSIDDVMGHIYIWENTATAISTSPADGEEVLAFTSGSAGWYGFGIHTDKALDITHYADGYLHLSIKTNSTDEFWISIGGAADVGITFTNGSDPYGFQRDGEWHRLTIPVSDFVSAGVNLEAVGILFSGGGVSIADIAFDDIVLSTSHTLPTNPNTNTGGSNGNEYEITADVYGLYSNNSTIMDGLLLNDGNGNLYIWEGTLSATTDVTAYEGTNVLAFSSTGKGWFGFGINSENPLDLTHFSDGYLHFMLKTTSTTTFTMGIEGAGGSEGIVEFIDGSDPYNFERDGEWHQISIPISALTAQGLNLLACGNVFKFVDEGEIDNIAIDDIVLSKSATPPENPNIGKGNTGGYASGGSGGETNEYEITSDVYAVYSNNPSINNSFRIDEEEGHIYIWDNTLVALTDTETYEGTDVLSFKSNNVGWYGFGIFSDNPLDLTHFASGYLHFSLKTSSNEEIWFGVQGAGGSEGKITMTSGNTQYDFERDGQWHTLSVPVSDLVAGGLDLSACSNIFILGGTSIDAISIDDIVFSTSATPPNNPLIGGSMSNDATLSNLTVDGTTITGFEATTTLYTFELDAGTTDVPTVAATANSGAATVTSITDATSLPGTTAVLVTAEDGSTLTYQIYFTVAQTSAVSLQSEVNAKVFSYRKTITVLCNDKLLNSKIEVFDVAGKVVNSSVINSTHYELMVQTSGIYIVRIVANENNTTVIQKVLIR